MSDFLWDSDSAGEKQNAPGERFNPNDPRVKVLGGTAPGDMPLMLQPGMAKRIPAGARLVLQLHYTPNGRAQKDRSKIGLIFSKEPPKLLGTRREFKRELGGCPGVVSDRPILTAKAANSTEFAKVVGHQHRSNGQRMGCDDGVEGGVHSGE